MAKLKGNRIRERRHGLGIKQEDLAKAVKISVSSVNRFERNKGEPKAPTLREIARHIDVLNFLWLFNDNKSRSI